MNWYLVTTPHDAYAMGDVVALEGGLRELEFEKRNYLKLLGPVEDPNTAPQPPQVQPEWLAEEPSTRKAATTPKRGRRGKQAEDEPAVDDSVQPDAGGEARNGDSASDRT